nr:protein FAR1-related sequence 5-like [Tanacetum cinerariifolium]
MTEGGDSNDIRSTYDEIDEEDEVFRSDYTEIHSIHYVKDADSDICEEIELSDGTFNYKPTIDESGKPKIGSEYSTIYKCIEMYAKYAEKSRFTIRKSTQEKLKSGIRARKYLLCNKEGFPKGCLARVKFKINVTYTWYVLYEFEEAHNHTFVPKAYRNHTKKRKQMIHPEQIFVQQLGSTSIGATRAHHLYASTHGGYESVNATETEYQNHKRDLNAHIGEGDAQILITKMTNRKLHVDNYKEFGDTISFDTTFITNKYNMVFVHFTGIDNHRKCVTFGAGDGWGRGSAFGGKDGLGVLFRSLGVWGFGKFGPPDESLSIPLDEVQLDDKLHFIKERTEIMDREVKRLKQSRIPIVKKRRNDVKARTTLLLALPDEHQLRFCKYETAKELWEAILKTFGGNKTTKKTKKNQLRQQYGNFKAEGSENLEKTFNRLHGIVSHLEFMDVEIEQDDLNQKFLTSLAPEWLMYTIVWGNGDDLDTMTASLSHDTVCAYIASQSNGSHIKYEDITQIDEDDIKEMDIKWNMALLSMRADRFWKKTESAEHLEFKTKSYMANEEESHALVANDEVPTKFALMDKLSSSLENEVYDDSYYSISCFESTSKDLDNLLGSQRSDKNKEGLGNNVIPPPAQVYSPPKNDLPWTGLPEFVDDTITDYSRPTPIIDASKCNTSALQSSNFSVSKHEKSSGNIMSKPMIKFVKEADCPRVIKTNNTENAWK